MLTITRLIIVFMLFSLLNATEIEELQWKSFFQRGKGIEVYKLKYRQKVQFYVVGVTNRKMSTSSLKSQAISYTTFDSLLKGISKNGKQFNLSIGNENDLLFDDKDYRFVKLSNQEVIAIRSTSSSKMLKAGMPKKGQ